MRIFEIITLILIFPFIAWPLLPWQRPRWVNLLPFVALGSLIVHWVWEGLRWQMIPAYLLVVVTVILAMVRMLRPLPAQNNNKKWTAVATSLLGLVWLSLAFLLPIALPVPNLMPPTGQYAIGTATYHLTDESRPEIYSANPDDNRELMVQLWYPADVGANAQPDNYLADLGKMGSILAERLDLPPFLLNHINLTDVYAFVEPPVAEAAAPFPVIVFAHGLTGIRGQNRYMVNELVSHGFVVAAADHTYANLVTIFPDGRHIIYDPALLFDNGAPNSAGGNQLVGVWADDIGFMLDEMASWQKSADHPLAGSLDLSHSGVFGHSTGGGATLEFCLSDGRCQAGVGLDSWVGPVSDTIIENPLSRPLLFINSPAWLGPENIARGDKIINALPGDTYRLTIEGTEHFDFTDVPLLTPFAQQLGLTGAINGRYSLAIQNEYVLAFFRRYLQGADGALLARPLTYPELSIETYSAD